MSSNFFEKLFKFGTKGFNTIEYWKERGKKYGERAVLNLAYSPEKMDEVTVKQRNIIFPLIKKYLSGTERKILDFGCGPGRFTKELSLLIGGSGIGIDPVEDFITIARERDPVNQYLVVDDYAIPFADNYFDVIWICLVMGGISTSNLKKIENEITRVAKFDALLILIENTTVQQDHEHWYYRPVDFYENLFAKFNLVLEGEYEEFEETVSIMIGKKNYANISY